MCAILIASILFTLPSFAHADDARLKVLFLGDRGHHQPALRAADILAPLAKQGIDLAYWEDPEILRSDLMKHQDCLVVYANHERITPEQEKALLRFVEGGKGLVVLHCGAYCFLNSPKYLSLVGGQFNRHGPIREFQAAITQPKHPALKGVEEFSAADEPYEHHRLGDDIKVLMERRDKDGGKEPWTWVRTQGKGRVYYTASGHDERVFRHPGYHKLVAQGIRWASGKPDHSWKMPELKRVPAELPHYIAGPGKRIADMQAPLSPAESMKLASTPGGFKVELFAAEPDIVKPIAITWDNRGRAFVAESLDYPNDLQPAGKGRDRITLCEDTDGDGKADKFTVFADKLSIPTSIVYAPGYGLIVAQAPDMLVISDKKERKTLFTGFGTADTHAGPSNLRLGLDGWVYATCGYSGYSGKVGGKAHRFGQGIFRFKPDGKELEFLGSTSNNTWGLGLDESGEIFYSTANGEHSSHLAIPNRYFEQVRGWLGKGTARMADHAKMHPLSAIRQVDHHGGFTAAAGHAIYTARHFPAPFQNKIAFVAEPTGHLVHMVELQREGSSFVSRDRFNLFASLDEWSAPIAAEVGPDGAVWILDWYNIVVQHNPTPPGFKTGKGNAYETPHRDKKHGRIYRVVPQGSATAKCPDLGKAPLKESFETLLQNSNHFWRMQALWTMTWAHRDYLTRGDLGESNLTDEEVLKTGDVRALTAYLWALHRAGAFKEGMVRSLIDKVATRADDPSLLRTVFSMLPTDGRLAGILREDRVLHHRDLLVRRDALLALSDVPASRKAGEAVAKMLAIPENAKDKWIPLAATCAAARHDVGFLSAAMKQKDSPEMAAVVRTVAEHYARGTPDKELSELLASLKDGGPLASRAFLAGLTAGWPASNMPTLDKEAKDALVLMLPRLDADGKLALLTLGRRWGLEKELAGASETLRIALRKTIAATKADDKDRIEAAKQAVQLGVDEKTMQAILEVIGVQASPALASGLLDALGQSSAAEVGPAILEKWAGLSPSSRAQAAEVLLRRPAWTVNLLDALDKGTLNVGDLSAAQAQALAQHPDKKLAERARAVLERGGKLANPDRHKVLDKLIGLAAKTGDAGRGLEVFKKTCAKCHRHGDIGERIGPELTGFAVHPKEKILTEIIDPNRSVEGNFRQYSVVLKSGRIVLGLLASETKTAVEIVDSEAKRHAVLRQDIEEMTSTGKSIMPEGFEKDLKEPEIVDLLEFLSAKGKYVPLPLDKAATISSVRGMFYKEEDTTERLIFPDWTPKVLDGVPFVLVDPKGGKANNVVLLHGPQGNIPPKMPKSVTLPCNAPVKTLHLLSGVSGWGFPLGEKGSVSMVVRFHYADGKTEDHELKNGVHFADYIRRVDVPGSKLAYMLRDQQIRYLAVNPKRQAVVKEIELRKGSDATAPVVMAATAEQP